MTEGEIRGAIDSALGTVPFEPPVTPAYCSAVRETLRPLVPGAVLDVFFREGTLCKHELEVHVRLESRTVIVVLPLS